MGERPAVVVLGSGPIRIGQGIEFDYSCVHCTWALQKLGYRAIIVNNNPETVSTDFDTGDALYFEPVTLDDVVRIAEREGATGAMCQFGGQTAINLAEGLQSRGVPVLGTSPEAIAAAEDRDLFEKLLSRLDMAKPPGRAVRSLEEAGRVAEEIGYPVLVRPSFVLGGRAMEIVYDADQLESFYSEAERANPGQPVLVDRYFLGTEAEVDAISDGETVLVPGIMEHIERAGVHSGDSMAVFPPVSLDRSLIAEMTQHTIRLAREIGVKGLINVQFVIKDGRVFVLEVNPRASRTVPYLSKVTGVQMVDLATRAAVGEKLDGPSGLWNLESGRVITEEELAGDFELPDPGLYAVKAPVFSFQKLSRVEPSLGPEMKSTGEVLGIDTTFEAALYKALVAAGIQFRDRGQVILSVRDSDKKEAVEIARSLHDNGYSLAATSGTCKALKDAGVPCDEVMKIQEGSPSLLDLIMDRDVSLMINTPEPSSVPREHSGRIRRACIETGAACITNIDSARALASALGYFAEPNATNVKSVTEYLDQARSQA